MIGKHYFSFLFVGAGGSLDLLFFFFPPFERAAPSFFPPPLWAPPCTSWEEREVVLFPPFFLQSCRHSHPYFPPFFLLSFLQEAAGGLARTANERLFPLSPFFHTPRLFSSLSFSFLLSLRRASVKQNSIEGVLPSLFFSLGGDRRSPSFHFPFFFSFLFLSLSRTCARRVKHDEQLGSGSRPFPLFFFFFSSQSVPSSSFCSFFFFFPRPR